MIFGARWAEVHGSSPHLLESRLRSIPARRASTLGSGVLAAETGTLRSIPFNVTYEIRGVILLARSHGL